MSEKNLIEAQEEFLNLLKDSYEHYNRLVQNLIDVADDSYTSVYEIKRAILSALSKSLHENKRP